MALPTLSIIIPTHNGRMHLERCLPTVQRYAPPGTQVLVVDDASTDGTPQWLARTHAWVERVILPANRGFCGAVNTGIALARGQVIELLNDDTAVEPGWADAALRHFANPAVGSVAPLVLSMTAGVIDSAGIEYDVSGWARNRHYGQALSADHLRTREVFGPSGSSGFYRRSALDRAGTLLPQYGAYFEDVDLAFRLRWAGFRCIYEPASRVRHQGSASYGQESERLAQLLSRNEELVFWVNLPERQLAMGLLPHLGFLAVRLVRRARAGQLMAYLAGKAEALRLVRWVSRRRTELRKIAQVAQRSRSTLPLDLAGGVQVLRDGWLWLRQRKCA